MSKKTKDILLGVIKGEKEANKPKRKKKTEKPVEIYGPKTSVREIAISDIKDSVRWKVRENLSEWKNSDFTIYFIQQFRENINNEWQASRLAMILYFGKTADKINDIFGFCDNIILKDYIDFFIKEWAMYFWKEKGNFTLWYLNDDRPIKDFIKKYDYSVSFNKFISGKKTNVVNSKKHKKEVSSKEIEQYYFAGGEGLIMEYGLLIPVNWLIKCKGYSIERANLYIVGAFGSLCSIGNWKEVVSKTESLNPYPESFVVRDCSSIFKKLNLEIDLKLTFSKEDWCEFSER